MHWSAFTSSLTPSRRVRAVMLAAVVGGLGCGLGGCANVGAASGNVANAQASMGNGATVAFESVDGPPPQVFERLVSLLDSEARLRNLAVVSRQEGAAYRVRSYLSAQIRGGRNNIAWVWDVYDRDQQRTLRLTGEEQTGKSGGDAWAAADDLVLRRIAQAGLTGLSAVINGTSPSEVAPAAPRSNGPAIANSTDAPTSTLAFADDNANGSVR